MAKISMRFGWSFLFTLGCLGGCRTAEAEEGPRSAEASQLAPSVAAPALARPSPALGNATFGYLLSRYDNDGDRVITATEYTRRDGQFDRWDRDGDGNLSEADWGGDDLRVTPQIMELQRQRVLGRYFQTDEDVAVLTIDEMAEAFLEYYDGAAGSTSDEELSEEEFRAAAAVRAVALPGDESMQLQNYSGGTDPWFMLVSMYDYDRNGMVGLLELCRFFEEENLYELHFDREHADAGAEDGLDYELGLPKGSVVPDLELAALHGDEAVSLRDFVNQKPVVLIFGSYT